MWRRQSTLLFLTVAVMVISGQDPVILDKHHSEEVKVPLGSKLIFKCNFSTVGFERFVVKWYFNRSGPPSESDCFNKSTLLSSNDTGQHSGNILLYHISNATKENSGWYFCKVTAEIPALQEFESQRRFVNIMKSMEHTTHPSLPIVTDEQAAVSPEDNGHPTDWWLWIAVGVSSVILVVLLVICILLRRRYRSSREEEPIYVNTHPKQPSPRPVGHLKTASSSQSLHKPNRSPGKTIDRGKQRYR